MNSQWRAYRIGLIDFWYYDEEEFHFLDGRMLLRGSNGSGKSVTMQSFIPLILDGNMRPERLDPFGSRARKMENYLLEEGDGREERTGYLYMEFKRQEEEVYLTLGIGMRAHVNKKLEVWYFTITDGRRIGKDFFLYKDERNKIACTRLELRNRIGDGGRLFDSQREYAEAVNKLLFGFETAGEYKEMLELLIQLRTPKLSKDFKPTVINEILSNSLQTLSEDDLRPMSEAIENMDSLKTNLDSLRDSVQAARQIEKVYDQYNRIVLYNKAQFYTNASEEYEVCRKREADLEEKTTDCHKVLERERIRYENLAQEEAVLAEEKKSLDQSDAARLKEQEQDYLEECRELSKSVKEKEKQREDKREKRQDIENKIKNQEEDNEEFKGQIQTHLEDMDACMEGIPFDEFTFLKQDLLQEIEGAAPDKEKTSYELKEKTSGIYYHVPQGYDFRAHNQLFQTYLKNVEEGTAALEMEKKHREKYDETLQQADQVQAERDRVEKELHQYENLLHEIKAELIENVYGWERENRELKIPELTMQQISRQIDEFRQGQDYSEIRETLRVHLHEREDVLRAEYHEESRKEQEIQKLLREKQEELAKWKAAKDPEPEKPETVMENRRRLTEAGIPFLQFYKTVDFEYSLSPEQMSRLEETLLEMGILDALIIPSEYRNQVLAMDEGVCDKYIFSDVEHVKNNLLQLLDVDNAENDIIFYQKIANILSGIAYTGVDETDARKSNLSDHNKYHTWISERGNYRLGILEGTITGKYEAKYIGVQARERFRRRQIEILEEECTKIEQQLIEVLAVIQQKEASLKQLHQEWNTFPSGDDLKTAARSCGEKEYEFNLVSGRIVKLKNELEQQRRALEEIRLKAQKICSKTYLKIRLDIFKEALENLREYKEHLTQIEIIYARYQNGMANLSAQMEYLEDIDGDLDDILYDLTRTERKLSEAKRMAASIQEQLALTNYEEIKARLDHCIRRLREIPGEKENSVRASATLKENIRGLKEKQSENEKSKTIAGRKADRFSEAFWEEYRLGYVQMEENADSIDRIKLAGKVCRMLEGKLRNRKQSDFLGNVQEAYHQNRGFLLEYNLTMVSLFDGSDGLETSRLNEEEVFETSGISMKRIDIRAKYRGISVRFKELIEKLEADMEDQSRLLNDKDRELFEDILANTISKKIRARIQASKRWVDRMNEMMESMRTSSGLKLNLRWKNKRAEKEEQLDTRALVELLQKDVEIMRPDEVEQISRHFRSKINEARKLSDDGDSTQSFHMIVREVLDYRKWFEFQLESQKTGEKKKELTGRVFFTFSGGEKAMAMYVPLFSAVAAKYAGARKDAPRMISLDEAFAGVDEMNIRDMFRLMVEFGFDFMLNSQILWGDYDTVPHIAIYQLIRPENVKYVTVISYVWNGNVRTLVDHIGDEIEDEIVE